MFPIFFLLLLFDFPERGLLNPYLLHKLWIFSPSLPYFLTTFFFFNFTVSSYSSNFLKIMVTRKDVSVTGFSFCITSLVLRNIVKISYKIYLCLKLGFSSPFSYVRSFHRFLLFRYSYFKLHE